MSLSSWTADRRWIGSARAFSQGVAPRRHDFLKPKYVYFGDRQIFQKDLDTLSHFNGFPMCRWLCDSCMCRQGVMARSRSGTYVDKVRPLVT